MFQQGVATENGRGLTVQLPLLLLTKPWILVGHTTATAAKNTVNYYQSLNEVRPDCFVTLFHLRKKKCFFVFHDSRN